LQFTEFFSRPVEMFVFFLLNFAGGRTEDFAQGGRQLLDGRFSDQFPVGVILRFRKDDVFNRIQFGLVFRQTVAGPCCSAGPGPSRLRPLPWGLRASISAQALNHIGGTF